MEAGFVVIAIVLIVASAIGLYVLFNKRTGLKTKKLDTQGMLNLVYDEYGSNPQLVLALYDPVETVAKQKQALFDVNIIRQNSQK